MLLVGYGWWCIMGRGVIWVGYIMVVCDMGCIRVLCCLVVCCYYGLVIILLLEMVIICVW